MKYNNLSLGEIEAIVNKLGGMEGVKNFLSGKIEIVDNSLFDFKAFFKNCPGLYVDDNGNVERFSSLYPNSVPYRSIKNLKPVLTMHRDMHDAEIIEKIGGKENIRKNAVTMDQIARLITNQWGGKSGIMLTNGYENIFYVVGKESVLFAVKVRWCSQKEEWKVYIDGVYGDGEWQHGRLVFGIKD